MLSDFADPPHGGGRRVLFDPFGEAQGAGRTACTTGEVSGATSDVEMSVGTPFTASYSTAITERASSGATLPLPPEALPNTSWDHAMRRTSRERVADRGTVVV